MRFLLFTLRHLVRYWRLNLVVLAGILIGSTFAASPPLLASVLAGQSLAQSLGDATAAQGNLRVRASRISEDMQSQVDQTLGGMKLDQVELRQAIFFADPTITRANGEGEYTGAIIYLQLWSIDRLPELTQMLEGRLPDDSQPEPGVVEAAVGAYAAEAMNLHLGDELLTDDEALHLRVRIVGIVEPNDPSSELWWGDERLLPFNALRESGLSDYDTITISTLLTPQAMLDLVPGFESSLRVVLDRSTISVRNAETMRQDLLGLEARLSAEGAQMDSGLIELIQDYQDQSRRASVSLILLTAQSFLAILYTLGMLSTYLLDQSRLELAMLANRGYSRGQIVQIFALEIALLAFGVAFPLGPLLALAGFSIWSTFTGIPTPGSLPPNAWALSFAAAAFAWLALVLPMYFAAKQSIIDWERTLSRPKTTPVGRQLALDGALLAFGGLAYWQLRETGSTVRATQAGTDPILLIGPTLLLFAVGLIFIRLFPYLLRAVARLTQSARGLPLAMGLNRLARLPTGPNRVVLLISLTIGLSLFASVFSHSVLVRQEEMAQYLTGADLRLTQSHDSERADADLAELLARPGVNAAAQVFRTRSRWGEGSGIMVDFLAVDPDTFVQVSHFPDGYRDVDMAPIMAALGAQTTDAIPIVLSYDAPPRGAHIGDRVQYRVGRETYDFEVRGIIVNFPTLTTPFAVTNLAELSKQVNLGSTLLSVESTRELWVDVDPEQHTQLVTALQAQPPAEAGLASYEVDRIAADAEQRLGTYQADLVSRTATTAFRLNTLILGTLSVMGYLLIQVFAIRGRRKEFAVLQALGLSARQLLGLLFLEGLILMVLGVTLGVGIGFGLANLMRSFLSITLAASLGGGTIDRIVFDWPSIARNLSAFLGFYVAALLLLLVGLLIADVFRAMRVSEE